MYRLLSLLGFTIFSVMGVLLLFNVIKAEDFQISLEQATLGTLCLLYGYLILQNIKS